MYMLADVKHEKNYYWPDYPASEFNVLAIVTFLTISGNHP